MRQYNCTGHIVVGSGSSTLGWVNAYFVGGQEDLFCYCIANHIFQMEIFPECGVSVVVCLWRESLTAGFLV